MTGWDYYQRYQHPQEQLLAGVERTGILIDVARCYDVAADFSVEIAQLTRELPDINWGSPKQIAAYLYDDLALEIPPICGGLNAVKMTKKGERPTSEAAIQWLSDKVEDRQTRQTLRKAQVLRKKLKHRSFAESLPKHVGSDGRVHGQISATTETGRLAMSNPCMHQQPPSIRSAVVAKPGHKLLVFDYAQLEYRVMAHIVAHNGDYSLVNDVKAGIDPHGAAVVRLGWADCGPQDVAEKHPKLRKDAKAIVYGIPYGKTGAGLGVQIRDDDGEPIGTAAGQDMLDEYYEANPGVRDSLQGIRDYAKQHGYVRSLLGRYRYLPDINHKKQWIREKQQRLAQNVIQNCAADLVMLGMLRTNTYPDPDWFNETLSQLGCKLVLQVHDELVYEVPEENAHEAAVEVKWQMEHVCEGIREFLCPLEVTGGPVNNWGDGH